MRSSSASTSASTVASRVSAAPDLLDWARGLVSIAFILLLPMLIIGTSVRTVFTDRDFILQGFRDNQVGVTTGLDDPQLQRVADAFVAYFQALVQFFLRMQIVAAAVVVLRVALAFTMDRTSVPLGREMLLSVALMIAAIVVVGAMALVDFDAFWTRFHQLAFRNGLWLLDPTRDYLIMLFPEPFWFAGTIRFVALVGAQTALVALLGLALLVVIPRLAPQSSSST
jgi:integral membrane protein (TIGR01906 family)